MNPDLLAQLGLPATWAPVPLVWGIVKLHAQGDAGGETVHLLVVDSANGRVAFQFTPDELRSLGEKAMEQAAGIAIATEINTNGGKFHR